MHRTFLLIFCLFISLCGSSQSTIKINAKNACKLDWTNLDDDYISIPDNKPDGEVLKYWNEFLSFCHLENTEVRLIKSPGIKNFLISSDTDRQTNQPFVFIAYDPEMIEKYRGTYNLKWIVTFALAHEYGHLANGHIHSMLKIGTNRSYENNADYYAFTKLCEMHAPLNEAQMCIFLFTPPNLKSNTYPSKDERLKNIVQYYSKSNCGEIQKKTDPVIKTDLPIQPTLFNSIKVNVPIAVDIKIDKNSTGQYKVHGDRDAQKHIFCSISNNILNIETDLKRTKNLMREVNISVSVPNLAYLSNISGKVNVTGDISGNRLEVGNASTGDVSIENVKVTLLLIKTNGTGDVTVNSGSATKCRYTTTGTGSIFTNGVKVKEANVSVSGTGDCRVNAESLDATIVGTGDIIYSGRPTIRQNVLGTGEIKGEY